MSRGSPGRAALVAERTVGLVMRFASVGIHHIDLTIPIAGPDEGDLAPVRNPQRIRVQSWAALEVGQTAPIAL